jgi:1,4-alpha-glucan branching enzyme
MGGKYSSLDPMEIEVPEIDTLLSRDPYLKPYEREIRRRYGCFKDLLDSIEENGGGLDNFTQGYKYYGIHVQPDNSIVCREWAPGAVKLFLTGEFNGWNRDSHPYKKKEYGKWELIIPPNRDGSCAISHLSELKVLPLIKNNIMIIF